MSDSIIATADICPHGMSSSLCEWCQAKATAECRLSIINGLRSDLSRVTEERDQWRGERDRLSKLNQTMLKSLDSLRADLAEEQRLNAMGSEREARLMAQVEELKRDRDELKAGEGWSRCENCAEWNPKSVCVECTVGHDEVVEAECASLRSKLAGAVAALKEISMQPDIHVLAAWSHERARKALAELRAGEDKL